MKRFVILNQLWVTAKRKLGRLSMKFKTGEVAKLLQRTLRLSHSGLVNEAFHKTPRALIIYFHRLAGLLAKNMGRSPVQIPSRA